MMTGKRQKVIGPLCLTQRYWNLAHDNTESFRAFWIQEFC
jgi:hypothetical protein